jgi:hypothetical protein
MYYTHPKVIPWGRTNKQMDGQMEGQTNGQKSSHSLRGVWIHIDRFVLYKYVHTHIQIKLCKFVFYMNLYVLICLLYKFIYTNSYVVRICISFYTNLYVHFCILQICVYKFVLIYDWQTKQKKTSKSEKRDSPLIPGTRECLRLVPQKFQTRARSILFLYQKPQCRAHGNNLYGYRGRVQIYGIEDT